MREEEKESLSPASQSDASAKGDGKSSGRPMTRGQQKRHRQSVFQYIAILFAAAFVLLLFTFVMERRQHELLQEENEEQINNLQQSVSAVQSLNSLYSENAALKEQVQALEDQISELEDQAGSLEEQAGQLSAQLERTAQAMDWFWQIDEAYVRGRYTLCQSLIQSLEDAGLVEYLPKESATDNDRFSPYDRYQEIYDALY